MIHEYLSYIEDDPQLYAVLKDKLPQFERLSPAQVEKLVFWLKSLQNYYPKSEAGVTHYDEFTDKLENLRNSPEQITLQRRASRSLLKGIALCVIAGLLLAIALANLLGGQMWLGIGCLGAAISCILVAESKLMKNALIISKEQDRKYFLASIRAARSCNELDWAGLFAYSPAMQLGPRSADDTKRIDNELAVLTGRLRAALYNDKYFEYSSNLRIADSARSEVERG